MTHPAVSVVIAAYNAEGTLAVQLEALAGQVDAPAFEVLVCDNGSTDGTAGVVEAFADRVPGLRRVDASRKRGPGAARNIGADAAAGATLLFCDADDMVTPPWVGALAAPLRGADLAAGPWGLSHFNPMYAATEAFTPPTFTLSSMPGLRAAGAGNLGVTREAFAALGGFDEALRVGEDIDLCWRAQLAGYVLVEAPDAVVQVRRPTSVRGSWRQAFAYGRAERQLADRYSGIGGEGSATAAPPGTTTEGAHEGAAATASGGRGPIARVRSLAEPFGLQHAAQTYGRRCGARWGRVDRGVPRLPRTDATPPPVEAR